MKEDEKDCKTCEFKEVDLREEPCYNCYNAWIQAVFNKWQPKPEPSELEEE